MLKHVTNVLVMSNLEDTDSPQLFLDTIHYWYICTILCLTKTFTTGM